MRGSGLPFSSRPWRVQHFDISVGCGIEVKLCHNLPLRGLSANPGLPMGGSGSAEKIFHASRNPRRGIGITGYGTSSWTLELVQHSNPASAGFFFTDESGCKESTGSAGGAVSGRVAGIERRRGLQLAVFRHRRGVGNAFLAARSEMLAGDVVLAWPILFTILAYLGLLTNGLSHGFHPRDAPALRYAGTRFQFIAAWRQPTVIGDAPSIF
jgi:hypothetical protein